MTIHYCYWNVIGIETVLTNDPKPRRYDDIDIDDGNDSDDDHW